MGDQDRDFIIAYLSSELERLRDDLGRTIADKVAPMQAEVSQQGVRLSRIEEKTDALKDEMVQVRHGMKVAEEMREKVERHDSELRRIKQATTLAGAAAGGVISAVWESIKSRF